MHYVLMIHAAESRYATLSEEQGEAIGQAYGQYTQDLSTTGRSGDWAALELTHTATHVQVRDGKRDRGAIALGKELLNAALASGPPGPYAIEAAIQAVHDDAPTYSKTDFRQLVALYGLLADKTHAPLVRVSQAVARAMVDGPEAALPDLPSAVLARRPAVGSRGCARRGRLRCPRASSPWSRSSD